MPTGRATWHPRCANLRYANLHVLWVSARHLNPASILTAEGKAFLRSLEVVVKIRFQPVQPELNIAEVDAQNYLIGE